MTSDQNTFGPPPGARATAIGGVSAIEMNLLTKRELIAALIFQGLVAGNKRANKGWAKALPAWAVFFADELIDELDKPRQKGNPK